MSALGVQIHPAALAEADAAQEWYAKRSPGAAEAFLTELDNTIERISQHPDSYQLYEFKARRALVRRFPYLIVFRKTPGAIEIIAVAHARPYPGYWRDRV